MRPPRIAAEYEDHKDKKMRELEASMRPPRIAAEYAAARRQLYSWQHSGFNEAAANRGGIRFLQMVETNVVGPLQ